MKNIFLVAVLISGPLWCMDRPVPLLSKKNSPRIQRIQESPRQGSPRQAKPRFASLACLAARCLAHRYDLVRHEMIDLITPKDQVCVKEVMLRELIKPHIFPLVIAASQNKESVHHNGVCGLDFNSATDEVVSGACDGKIVFCNKKSLAAGTALITDLSISALSISPWHDEIYIGTDGNAGKICKMNYQTKKMGSYFEAHQGNVTRICVGTEILASCSTDKTVRVWNKKTAELLIKFTDCTQAVRCLELIEDDTVLIAGTSEGKIRVWSLPMSIHIASFLFEGEPRVWGMGYMPSSNSLAVGLNSGRVSVIDASHLKEIHQWYGHGQTIAALSCDPQEKYFATASWDTKARLWDIRMRACAATFEGHKDWLTQIKCLGNEVVTGSKDHTLKLWDIRKIKDMDSQDLLPVAAMAARLKDRKPTIREPRERDALLQQLLTKTS